MRASRAASKTSHLEEQSSRRSRALRALLSPHPHCYRAPTTRKKHMKGPEDDAGLAGKVALISGGGAAGDGVGNGRAAAILLARAGAKVLVADRDLKLAERTAEMIA